jgi:hypothetical protein
MSAAEVVFWAALTVAGCACLAYLISLCDD